MEEKALPELGAIYKHYSTSLPKAETRIHPLNQGFVIPFVETNDHEK